jgi:hypothetical protein
MSGFRSFAAAVAVALLSQGASAQVGPTYVSGRISNITFTSGSVMFMLDTGLPANCVGSAYGWMTVPMDYKPIVTILTGIWLRGDADSTVVTAYADGLVNGYCRISQLDPAN